jgi:hypothetical protein
MLTSGVVFLHDNALPYTAAHTRSLLEHFNSDLFYHHVYSPELAPNDYYLFTYLKNWLRSQSFKNNRGGVDGRCQNVAELTDGRLL